MSTLPSFSERPRGEDGPPPPASGPPPPASAAERATPFVLLVLGVAFTVLTVLLHLDAGRAATPTLSEAARTGRAVFLRNNCAACHQFYGLGGFAGPDLTNAYTRRGEAYMRSVLGYGMGNMKRIPLRSDEIDALIEYLHDMDRTGKWPVEAWPPVALPN